MSKYRMKSEKSKIEILLTGLLFATLSLFATMIIAAIIAYIGDDPTYKSELWSFGAMLLSGVIAGYINAKAKGEDSTLIAVLSALALVLILFIIGTIAYGVPSLPTIVNYAIYIGISGISAFFGARKPKRRHR